MSVFAAAAAAARMTAVVMVAVYIRIVIKTAGDICTYSVIGRSGYTAEQLYPGLSQGHLRTASDAAADQYVYIRIRQILCKGTVPLTVCSDYLFIRYLPVFDIIDLELFCVPEMLENISVIICYCYSHCICSFRRGILYWRG